ncbi:MAG: hypothetical protein H9W81_07475 [Enterococcus sp.]|nr:hypothetical protein [Enterococcus sp.]
MSRKVIIVGPEVIHDFFKQNYEHWDVQEVCEDIETLWTYLPEGKLSEDSDIVILVDELYESNPEGFTATVASLSPAALVMVLSYTEGIEEYIVHDVAALNQVNEVEDESPFYFIRPEIALAEIQDTVNFYDHGKAEAEKAKKNNKAVAIDASTVQSTNSVDTSRDGIVVTVTSPKGGSGKSTVALLLATQLAKSSAKAYEQGITERPLDVCIVDLDTFDGQLGFVLGQMQPTALNIALSESIFDASLVKNNLIFSERMGVHALLAPVRGATARYTDPAFYQKTIRTLKTMFDVVILDTSVQHYDDLIRTVALPEADAILLVTTLDIKSVKGLARWMDVARTPIAQGGHGVDQSKIGIVVNGSIQGVGMGSEELTTAALGAKLLVAIPLDTKAVQLAGNSHRLEDIVEHPTIGPMYYKLAQRIAKAVGSTLVPLLDPPTEEVASAGRSTRNSAKPAGRWGRKQR